MTTLKGNQLADFRANEIGFIFQDFNLLESLTAQENIAVPLSLQGVRRKEIKQRVQKIAERLSIAHILESYPSEYFRWTKTTGRCRTCIDHTTNDFIRR